MKPYPSSSWTRLIGVPVEIRRNCTLIRAGVVDDAMPNPAALWLAADAAGHRELFTAAEGYQVWIQPRMRAALRVSPPASPATRQ